MPSTSPTALPSWFQVFWRLRIEVLALGYLVHTGLMLRKVLLAGTSVRLLSESMAVQLSGAGALALGAANLYRVLDPFVVVATLGGFLVLAGYGLPIVRSALVEPEVSDTEALAILPMLALAAAGKILTFGLTAGYSAALTTILAAVG